MAKERPILFSAPMVRAILAGTKTQTRRLITRGHHIQDANIWAFNDKLGLWESGVFGDHGRVAHGEYVRCPYGQPGDRLWVKETFAEHLGPFGESMFAIYRADFKNGDDSGGPWRPSIFMPRWASRLTLEVEAVRIQRLQDISEADAKAEGVTSARGPFGPLFTDREAFALLWDSINAKRAPWSANPWVFAVSFRVVSEVQNG